MADWSLSGNTNIDPTQDFLGTTDTQPLIIKTAGVEAIHINPATTITTVNTNGHPHISGSVGIGTSDPAMKLHVSASDQLGILVQGPGRGSGSVGAGIQLDAQGIRNWELLATGEGSAQGQGKLNVRNLGDASDVFTITGDDNVGIGTTNPDAKLEVSSGGLFDRPQLHLRQTTPEDFVRVRLNTSEIGAEGPQPKHFWDIAVGGGDNVLNIFHQGAEGVQGPGNVMTFVPHFRVVNNRPAEVVLVGIGTEQPQATLHVVGNVRVDGALSATSKSFIQAHPVDERKEVVYMALEGGEAGTYVRGTARLCEGEAVIALPEHFSLVTSEEGLSIQLTPRDEWLQLYAVRLNTEKIIVQETQGKSGQFDYLLQGVRKGYENHQSIQEKVMAGGTGFVRSVIFKR